MVFQQNAIASESRTAAAPQARIQFHRAVLVVLLMMGITILLSLYVYQASVNYTVELRIEQKKVEYAREQRLLAAKLQLLGESQNITTMVARARAAGYGPPEMTQIRYVREDANDPLTFNHPTAVLSANR
ncbi:MAG TPA: hypothetical protein ENK60_08760 [Anaerolineae bacterium]|nr:hypothetical protein [Anaerolineae bacterium]